MGLIGKLFGGSRPPASDVYLKLRTNALNAASDRDRPPDPHAQIRVVLMEMGMSDAVATFACYADGTASLYLSTGGGVIGGGEHESVRTACLEMMSLTNKYAHDFIAACNRVSAFPFPAEGEVFFYLVTGEGVYQARCREDALEAQRDPFSALFNNCHAVMTEVRKIDEQRSQLPRDN